MNKLTCHRCKMTFDNDLKDEELVKIQSFKSAPVCDGCFNEIIKWHKDRGLTIGEYKDYLPTPIRYWVLCECIEVFDDAIYATVKKIGPDSFKGRLWDGYDTKINEGSNVMLPHCSARLIFFKRNDKKYCFVIDELFISHQDFNRIKFSNSLMIFSKLRRAISVLFQLPNNIVKMLFDFSKNIFLPSRMRK